MVTLHAGKNSKLQIELPYGVEFITIAKVVWNKMKLCIGTMMVVVYGSWNKVLLRWAGGYTLLMDDLKRNSHSVIVIIIITHASKPLRSGSV